MNRGLIFVAALAALPCGVTAAGGFWAAKTSSPGPANSRDLLNADQAFHLVSASREGDTIKVNWDIAPGYYLYRKRLGFQAVQPAGAALEPPQLPRGEIVHDDQEGDAEVYRNNLLAVLHWPHGAAAPQKLHLSWQGCAEAGVCYPPQSGVVEVLDLSR